MKIAIIGCGKQAPKHIGGLRSSRGVEVVLVDADPALAQALAEETGVEWVETVQEVLDDPGVVAIDICTPVTSHVELIEAGLAAGKDFFCEKPLCSTSAEAREIQAQLEGSGRIGMVGFNYRFAPAMAECKRVLSGVAETGLSPVLGKITSALLRVGGRGGHQLWKHQKAEGGGAINEMLIHLVDLSNWFFGPIEHAHSFVEELLRPERPISGQLEKVDAEDFVLVRLTSRSGIESFCQADLITPSFMHYIDIQGENGTFFGSIQPDMPSFLFCVEAAGGYDQGRTDFDFGHRNFFQAQMTTFVDALHDRVQPDGCGVEDSVNLLDAFEQIRAESPGS